MKTSIFLLLCLFSARTLASDFLLVTTPLPVSVASISPANILPKNDNPYLTPLGVTSRCYKAHEFLILSENQLGNGYELTRISPENAVCVAAPAQTIPYSNIAGLHLGVSKAKTLQILNVENASDDATLLYNKQIEIDGKIYDEQTWVDIQFTDNALSRLAIFVSKTMSE